MHVADGKTACSAKYRSRQRWIVGFVYVADGYKTTEAINSEIPLDFSGEGVIFVKI